MSSSGNARKTVIESLRVDGFGRFHDFELELGDGLNLLYGPNEAGKSTLWSFMTAMLFGFERRNDPGRYEPVGGSMFGGELRLKTVGGKVVVRRQGHRRRVDGEVVLRDAHGAPLPDSRLDEARGHVSRELFQQVFSLTIDQLRSFGDLAGSEVSERLYAAAMQGAQRLPAALDTLRKEAAELFAPKGQQRAINGWLRELQGVRGQLELLGDRPAEYAHDRAEIERLESALTTLETDVASAETRVHQLGRLHQALKPFEVLTHAETVQLGGEGLREFPLGAVERLETLVKTQAESQAGLHRAELERGQLDERLREASERLGSKPAPDPIRAALRQWDTVVMQAQALPAAQAQLDERGRQVIEALKRLPVPANDVAWLQLVDVGVTVQTAFKSLRDRHLSAREDRTRVTSALSAARDELQRRTERQAEWRDALARLPAADPSTLEAAATALNRVAALQQRLGHLDAQLATVTAQRRALEVPPPTAPRVHWPLWLAGVGTVGLVACAVVAWPLGAGPGALVFALVLGLLGLAASFRDETQTRHEQSAYDRARQYEREQRELRRLEASQLEGDRAQTRAELAQALAVGGAATESDVAHRIAEVRSALDDQQRRARLASQLAEAERESDRARHAVGELEHERARADATLDLIQTEVDERLAQLGVTASLSAEAALDVLTDLSRIQERALALEAERVGLGADTARVERAARALREQAAATGLGADQDPASLASLLNDWLSADAEERGQLATLQARHEASVGPLAQQRAALAQCTKEINAVLAAAKVDSVEAFRQKTAAAQAWAAAETDRQQALASLAVLGVDPQPTRPQLTDVAGLFDTLARANQALTALKAQREHQREALGRLRAKLEHVERDDEAAVLRAQEEALVAQLRPAVDRHVVSSLARAILEHARERFDADQQPRVVQRAAALFAQLTSQRYLHVRPEPGGRQLTVRDAQGVSWQVEQLSRGTRELLLLAFRLAVVEDFGEVRLALPVLLDDVTVNLDAERAERVIEVLAGLSKRHQVLAFTCHAPVRALFREAGARVHEVAQRTQLSLLPALGDAGGQT